MGNQIPIADWYERAANAIVRSGYNLFRWANENDLGLTNRDCENISRTKAWQDVLRTERNKFFKELANDPSRSKNTAVGQMLFAIQKMLDMEQYDKAVSALTQLMKAEGWLAESSSVNIFNDLNSKNIEELRKKLKGNTPESRLVN